MEGRNFFTMNKKVEINLMLDFGSEYQESYGAFDVGPSTTRNWSQIRYKNNFLRLTQS